MQESFDSEGAKKYLQKRELLAKERREESRKIIFSLACKVLKDLFSNTDVVVFLVGSIIKPYNFYSNSDIDIVLKNYKGDRFEIWTQLETLLNRKVEIIIFEDCHFKEHVEAKGYRVT